MFRVIIRAACTGTVLRFKGALRRFEIETGGREAITHWQRLERYGVDPDSRLTGKAAKADPWIASLLACRLETGRTHQIRVHLASIGHPLLGDQVYGSGFRTKTTLLPPEARVALADLARQALHSYLLTVKHPSSGEILQFRSELPPDLARLHSTLSVQAAAPSRSGGRQ